MYGPEFGNIDMVDRKACGGQNTYFVKFNPFRILGRDGFVVSSGFGFWVDLGLIWVDFGLVMGVPCFGWLRTKPETPLPLRFGQASVPNVQSWWPKASNTLGTLFKVVN